MFTQQNIVGDKCHDGKNSKHALTVMLGANCTWTHKLKPLLKPRNHNVFKMLLIFQQLHGAHPLVWITCDDFGAQTQSINKELKKENKYIHIFIDNCTAHGEIPKLGNINVKFAPKQPPTATT